MPRTFPSGVTVPTAGDRHPSEKWWDTTGATTDAAIRQGDIAVAVNAKAQVDALRADSVSRNEASRYGIPGPANSLSIGVVGADVVPDASIEGLAPHQTLSLVLPYGPRGPEGPGGSFQMRETADPGLFEVSEVESSALAAAIEPYRWDRGVIPTGADLRTLGPGSWSVNSIAAFDSLVNKPTMTGARGIGVLVVYRLSTGYKVLEWTTTPSTGGSMTFQSWQLGSGWVDWARSGWNRGEVPTGADVYTLAPGAYRVSSFATFDSLINAPAEARGIGTVEVLELTATARTIKWTTAPSTGNPRVLFGFVLATGFRGWFDHTPGQTVATGAGSTDTSNSPTTTNPATAALRNTMLREAFYRRYRTSTGGKAVVSLRFDDGHNAFKEKVLPLLRQYGFPYSLAVCSRRWDHTENNLVTPAEMNGWVINDKAEIWNHTATHRDAGGAVDEIVNGLTELRTQLPNAEIWGWYAPGIENGFNGFLPTREPHQLSATLGGQLALANHACVSGYTVGTSLRPIDPMPATTAGFAHYSLDGRTAGDALAEVDRVIAARGRENFMLHPSRLDLDAGIPLADFRALLEKLRTEIQAGRLLVLSPYQMEAATT